MANVIEVKELTKIYSKGAKEVKALDNVSLAIPKGSVFGLLGPNGAGKTTMIKILLGIAHQTSGSAEMLGSTIENHHIRKNIGYLPENHKFPLFLTGEEVIKYSAELSGFNGKNMGSKIEELLEMVKMTKWRKTKIKKYSKGMMQRIGLAQAMITDPEIIFLDEPTDGVDPIGRKEIRDIMLKLKQQGKTIFLNSHLLSEVELITDRIAILNKGKLIREGNVEDLTTKGELIRIKINSDFEKIYSIPDFKFNSPGNNLIEVQVDEKSKINEVIDILRKNEIGIESINPVKSSLEDLFINLIEEAERGTK